MAMLSKEDRTKVFLYGTLGGAGFGVTLIAIASLMEQLANVISPSLNSVAQTKLVPSQVIFSVGLTAAIGSYLVYRLIRDEKLRILEFAQAFHPNLHTDKTRSEAGHIWEWREGNACIKGHWRSTKGNLVMVFPSEGRFSSHPCWTVIVGDDRGSVFSGEDAEDRAFSVAASYAENVAK